MININYIHFSLEDLLTMGENSELEQNAAFLYISLIFMALVVSMFISFLILKKSRKESFASNAEISGGIIENIEVSNINTLNGMPNGSVGEVVNYFKGNSGPGTQRKF